MPDPLVASADRRRSYHTLDALRGIAAIGVVMYHYPMLLMPIRIGGAYLAVDLFFLMSGLVIAHAYQRRFDAGLSVVRFSAMRLCRLYPTFALGTAIAAAGIAAALAAHVPLFWSWRSLATATVSSALFLPSPLMPGKPPDLYPLNMPAWSLLFEIAINIAFAATYLWLRGRRLAVLIALGAAGVCAAAWMTGRLDGGVRYSTVPVGLARVTFSFFLDVAMYRAAARGGVPVPRPPVAAIVVPVAALLLFDPPDAVRPAYDALCVPLLFPALIWGAIHVEPRRGAAACTAHGLISYPLHMIHISAQTLVMGVIHRLLGGDVAADAAWLGFAVIGALLLLSWLLARHVDPPLRRAIERVVLARRARA